MSETTERRKLICLDYLGRVAADMYGDKLSQQELYDRAKLRLQYLGFALQYGCTKAEIRLALGITTQHLDQLIKTIEK